MRREPGVRLGIWSVPISLGEQVICKIAKLKSLVITHHRAKNNPTGTGLWTQACVLSGALWELFSKSRLLPPVCGGWVVSRVMSRVSVAGNLPSV